MKKYLMSGVAAIAFLAAFTSCSKSTDLYEEGRKEKDQQAQNEQKVMSSFEQIFEKEFGKPASDQNWGFEGIPVLDLTKHATTRGEYVNRNMWINDYKVPANVTTSEHDKVLAEFSKQRPVGTVNQNNVNWTQFFAYQVHKGTQTYNDANGDPCGKDNDKTGIGSDYMNHLQCYVNGTMNDLQENKSGVRAEHINDFNKGDHSVAVAYADNHNGEEAYAIRKATMMRGSGTVDFSYHNAVDSKDHNEYIIIAGADIDPSLAGYWYVGFDFYAHGTDLYPANKNMDVERDWVFNDWIIRISPAEFQPGKAKRIIAEDLAAGESDFDYNDVVFDVALANEWDGAKSANRLKGHIFLQAAGGTMPLYINGTEVHDLFGVDRGVMVNTNNGTVAKPIAMFDIDLGEVNYNLGSANFRDYFTITVDRTDGKITLGKAEIGEASEMIMVETTYRWCDERVKITDVYPKFAEWVKNKSIVWY